MSNFVLIHGGAHGPWCWDRVVPYLSADPRVKAVVAVDLQVAVGQGMIKDINQITLEDYVTEVIREIESRNLDNIIMVGHSMAGITIPPVVHRIPNRVKRVIYLATSNPVVGQSIELLMQHPLSPKSRGLAFEEMFCNDLDSETTQWILNNLRADPIKLYTEKVKSCLLPKQIKSTYILLERDQALLPEFQLEQARNAKVNEIIRFDSGHSAFASRPKDLAKLLLDYA